MTQRNEEWAKPTESGNDVHLVMEVIDETVRIQPEVLAGIEGKVMESAEVPPTVLSYGEAVNLIYRHGFRPIDLQTRKPLNSWKLPKSLRQQDIVPPETK
jgi:hypothetical protein